MSQFGKTYEETMKYVFAEMGRISVPLKDPNPQLVQARNLQDLEIIVDYDSQPIKQPQPGVMLRQTIINL